MSSTKYAKLEQDYQKLVSEMGVLRCRLESKSEALLILTRDLEQCQSERDQFKLMADQLRERHGELRRRLQAWGPTVASVYDTKNFKGQAEKSLAQLLCDLKEQNRRLQSENESLGQKLREALEDAKLLREQVQKQGCSRRLSDPCAQCSAKQDRQELVRQLEVLQSRCSMLECDLQAVLDEKEELVRTGDAYRQKVDRLNLQLNHALRGGADYVPLDVDALLMENRYMHERLQLAQEEKSLLTASLNKFKSLVEKNRGRASTAALAGVSSKQMQQLLQDSSLDLSTAGADLRNLVALLLEAVNDRTLALNHQRKANKVLGKRVTELENRLKCDGTWRVNMPLSSTDPAKLGSRSRGGSFEDGNSLCIGALELSTSKPMPDKDVPRSVISRENSRDEEEDCIAGEEDLPPELQRLLSAAMKELKSPQHRAAPPALKEVADLAC
ncbi:coiled-coil domain-containing protein 149 isoform X1 [Rhipicephalus microplus]|uniref:coiled-coil domain-containing protein 149 isoform X1 n=1 Tax=Rhipicephalus microplus TaxID=6941 RepID=UPI003F6B4930